MSGPDHRLNFPRSSAWLVFISAAMLWLVSCDSTTPTPEGSVPGYLVEGLAPELTVPDGAQVLGGGGGGGEVGMSTETYFLSELNLESVEQHYAAQLTTAGWLQVSRAEAENQVTLFWDLADRSGSQWVGKLEIVFGPPDFPDTYMAKVMILLPR